MLQRATDRRIEGFRDEHHSPFLHFADEGVEVRYLKYHHCVFAPGGCPLSMVGMAKVEPPTSYSTQTSQ